MTSGDPVAVQTPIRVSSGELERRWSAIRNEMKERGINALLMQNTNDWLGGYVRWFSDVPANNAYPRSIIFHADDLMTVVEMGPFADRRVRVGEDPYHRGVGLLLSSPAFASVDYTQSYDAELVVDELKRRGCRRVGFVGRGAQPIGFVSAIEGALSSAVDFVDATGFVDAIKAIKSPEEIALIREAAALQDAVFAEVLKLVRPEMRDIDVAAAAWHEGQVRGSEQGIVLGASAQLGEPSVFVGRNRQGRKLVAGDHLSLLLEINGPGGFYTEIGRTIVLGRASQELGDGFAAVHEMQDATLARMKPGASCREIAEAHDDELAARGLPPELRLYAHGQGYDMVERPLIRRDETMALSAGMCLAVHPGYETSSMFAVICDNYMIEADGPGACLHRTEKKVFEVG